MEDGVAVQAILGGGADGNDVGLGISGVGCPCAYKGASQ
jgi:hypothetical protein